MQPKTNARRGIKSRICMLSTEETQISAKASTWISDKTAAGFCGLKIRCPPKDARYPAPSSDPGSWCLWIKVETYCQRSKQWYIQFGSPVVQRAQRHAGSNLHMTTEDPFDDREGKEHSTSSSASSTFGSFRERVAQQVRVHHPAKKRSRTTII
jgi:hypothetical protein